MVLIGAISVVRGVLLFITQIIAGICAAALVRVLFQGELAVSTTLGGGTTIAQAVIIEMILTAQLVFTIFMLAAEKHQGNFVAPVGIGLSLFIAELTGEYSSLLSKLIGAYHRRSHAAEQTDVGILFRSFLDRRISESRPLIRPSCRHPSFSQHSVDILGRAFGWLPICRSSVQIDQIFRIRKCKP